MIVFYWELPKSYNIKHLEKISDLLNIYDRLDEISDANEK